MPNRQLRCMRRVCAVNLLQRCAHCLPTTVPEPGFVILDVERPWPVEIDSRTGVDAGHGHQVEGRRLGRFATFQSVIQRFGDKGADADAAGFGCAAHLLCKPVVKEDCGSHDALAQHIFIRASVLPGQRGAVQFWGEGDQVRASWQMGKHRACSYGGGTGDGANHGRRGRTTSYCPHSRCGARL